MNTNRKKIFSLISLISLCSLSFFIVQDVEAARNIGDAGAMLGSVSEKAGVERADIGTIAIRIIQAAISLTGLVFLIMTTYAGFRWMTARGNEQAAEKAKETLKAAIIGIVIVVSAYAISTFVLNRLVAAGGSNDPNQEAQDTINNSGNQTGYCRPDGPAPGSGSCQTDADCLGDTTLCHEGFEVCMSASLWSKTQTRCNTSAECAHLNSCPGGGATCELYICQQ